MKKLFHMKKFKISTIPFLFASVFLIAGIWGDCFVRLSSGAADLLTAVLRFDFDGVIAARTEIDDASYEALSYHDTLLDIDSIRNNLLGTRLVRKGDSTVVKADSGSLIGPSRRLGDSEIGELVSRFRKLEDVSEENGAEFLYCFAPIKELYETAPSNTDNYSRENCSRFLAKLRETGIPVLDLSEALRDSGIRDEDVFFRTDNHWKPYCGFAAAAAICGELSARYGFAYDLQTADIANYRVVNYPDWFLGSSGKKAGTYFTWYGADDFELITPGFETSLEERVPMENRVREGPFEETVLDLHNMKKDYYHADPYAVYSGGNYTLQVFRNRLNPDGKKILMIRDSFACTVAPFLALQAGELHLSDMRRFTGEKINAETYIRQIHPDYVLVLYGGIGRISGSSGKYDFFAG